MTEPVINPRIRLRMELKSGYRDQFAAGPSSPVELLITNGQRLRVERDRLIRRERAIVYIGAAVILSLLAVILALAMRGVCS